VAELSGVLKAESTIGQLAMDWRWAAGRCSGTRGGWGWRSASLRRKKGIALAGWATWAAQARWPAGRTEPKARKNSVLNKIGILEIAKALEICTTRFMRNFDVQIFPKFF
jgi:hypothetical protein